MPQHTLLLGATMNRSALFVVLAITLAIPQATSSHAFPRSSQASGSSTGGLSLRISAATETVPSQGAKFIVALQNTSNADFVLNLGVMLGNGKVMLPNAIHLLLTDRILGNTLALDFCGGPGAIAGRLDDYTVALQAGATYALPVSLYKYCGPAPMALGVKLLPGRYHISARFDGRGALTRNTDMAGVALLNFWTGTIQSDTLEFDVLQ
jgi:hypothetical protein